MIFIVNKKHKRVIVPTEDYCFKRLFGHVGNEEITKDLLEVILDRRIDKIDLDGNKILEKDLRDDKVGVLDIKTMIDEKEQCNIEMQVIDQNNIEKRLLFYWSKLYSEGIKESEKYSDLKRTIVILVANFELKKLKGIAEYHTEWQIREKNHHKMVLTNILELHIIEIPKTVYEITKKSNENLLYWLRFIENPKVIEEMEDMGNVREKTKQAVNKAKEELDRINADEYERRMADLRLKHRLDCNSIYSDGVEDGIEQGIKQGIEKGMEQGEKEKAIKIAKEMLKEGFDIDKITKLTGIEKIEIKKLKIST